jgi:Ca-activated chloride channel homolog
MAEQLTSVQAATTTAATRSRGPKGMRLPKVIVFSTGVRVELPRVFTGPCLMALLLLIVLPRIAWTQPTPPAQSRPVDPYTIRVNVADVVLHPTVENRAGTPVSGLAKDNFQIYENGVLQPIKYFSHEDIPVTVGLVVDNSGSIRPKRPDIVAAALAFARSSNLQDQMFVINFNENVSFGLPPETMFTDQPEHLEAALSRARSQGQTALYDAIATGLEQLKKGNRDKRVLIVITDGGDNASKHTLTQIMAMAGQSDAMIYTMGIFDEEDDDQNPHVLKQLSQATGGEAFLPKTLQEVLPICEHIARDIRNQYMIAYIPTNENQDGKYRKIQVKAQAQGRERLFVRTRAGYYALPKPQPSTASQSSLP